MNKIIITSTKFQGRILIWYRNGVLVKLSFEETPELTLEQQSWFLKRLDIWYANIFPSLENYMNKLGEKPFKVIEELEELTFEDFYVAFGYKEGKSKALSSWNRLSATEQMNAFLYIPRYKTKLKTAGTAQAYPATYLNQKRWED